MSLFAFLGIQESASIEVGATAPAISATDHLGQRVHFADLYRQGPVLVYFYPKADTPGCTAQACSLRDTFDDLTARGLQIVGVSGDFPEAQKSFRDKYELPFLLISDPNETVAKAFGVPTFLKLPKRQSFLIKEGRVVWRNLKVSPKTHVAEVRAALDAA